MTDEYVRDRLIHLRGYMRYLANMISGIAGFICKSTICVAIVLCVCLGPLTMATGAELTKPAELAKPTEKSPGRPPLIVMRQVEIKGKVFFLTEQGDRHAVAKTKIQVYSQDGKRLLYKSRTDKEGVFILPNLAVGMYKLKIGLLLMALKVEDPLLVNAEESRIPKSIVVFMPEGMEDIDSD